MLGPMISRPPAAIRTVSNPIMPGMEKCESAPWAAGSVKPSSISPNAVSARPIHCRRPIEQPSICSAMIASITMPPARTAWTSDSGATDIAATWNTHAPVPISQPIVNSGEANSALADWIGLRTVHRRGRAGSPMLVEEADVRRERAQKR